MPITVTGRFSYGRCVTCDSSWVEGDDGGPVCPKCDADAVHRTFAKPCMQCGTVGHCDHDPDYTKPCMQCGVRGPCEHDREEG